MVRAKLFWKDGTDLISTASRCLMKVGQKKQIRQYDVLALQDHSYEATPEERRRWEKNWHIVLK